MSNAWILFLVASVVLPFASAVLWAICVVIDTIAIGSSGESGQILRNPRQAIFMNSFMSIWGFALVPVSYWLFAPEQPAVTSGVLTFAAGCFWVYGVWNYFITLSRAQNPAAVGAWGASYPVWVALLSVPFTSVLLAHQWLGIVIVIASLWFVRQGGKLREEFGRLALYVGSISVHFVIMAYVAESNNQYWGLYPWYLSGVVLAGLVTLVLPAQRRELVEDAPKLMKFWWVFTLMEVTNVLALVCQTVAPALGAHPGVVTTIGSAFPVCIVLAEPLLRQTRWARYFPEQGSWLGKIFLLIVFAFGISLLLWK